jgi:LysM repeat protein
VSLDLKSLKTGPVLIYLLAAILLFLIGVVCGQGILSGGPSPSPPAPEAVFVTSTPGPAQANLAAALPGATPCTPASPAGWILYTVQPDDTLSGLAARFQISQGRILRANCLTSTDLLAGQELRLPSLPTPTPCAALPPGGWEIYTVQSGDTLSSLADARSITVDEIRRDNCLSSDLIQPGQQLYLPALPTPTPCVVSPAVGWELYTVQSGDNLFRLATDRGTNTPEVMRVNCLASDILQPGQQLYLPLLPTPTPTQPQPLALAFTPVAQLPSQPSPGVGGAAPAPQPPLIIMPDISLSRRRTDLPAVGPIPVVPPGQSRYPCHRNTPKGEPWISAPSVLEHGMRAYFFACEFTEPMATPQATASLTAQMKWPDGSVQPLDVQFNLPPFLRLYQPWEMGTAEGVVVWNAICNLPLGKYTLTMKQGQRQAPPFTFDLEKAKYGRILTLPRVGSVGNTFQVYYCGFTPNTTITVNLYYQTARLVPIPIPTSTPTPTSTVQVTPTPVQCPSGCVTPPPPGKCSSGCILPLADAGVSWGAADKWNVTINAYGWATHPLPSSPADSAVAYRLAIDNDANGEMDANDYFWLFR